MEPIKGIDATEASAEEIAAMADLARAALDEGAIGISTGLGYAPGVFANTEELIGVTAPLRERNGVYTSHARSYISLALRGEDSDTPFEHRASLDETAAVHRAHGVKVQHSHLIFVGDVTWPTTDRCLEHFDRSGRRRCRHGVRRLPVRRWQHYFDRLSCRRGLCRILVATRRIPTAASVSSPACAAPSRKSACAGATPRSCGCPDREQAHYEGMSIAEIARERGTDETETYLDLIAEMGPETRIINWNYSGRDDEESSLRKVLGHSRCCIETDTILTGNGFDNPASYGTFPRVLGRYVRELGMMSLPEAVRRMTGFSAQRMGLKDRGHLAKGLAADIVVFDPATVGDNTTRKAPDRSPSGIEMVVHQR